MIPHYLKAPPFAYIRDVVEFQLCVTVGLSGLILLLLMYRNLNKKRVEKQTAYYADQIIGEMLQFAEEGKAIPIINEPYWFEFRKRRVLKNTFLEHFNSVSGSEKEFLTKRYEDLGFIRDDYRSALSFFWWRRLGAVSNLSLIGDARFSMLFSVLTSDTNQLVCATAYLALSSLNHPLNRVVPVTDLPRAVIQRKNLLHEILRNWSHIHGHTILLGQIRSVKDPFLLNALVAAVSTLQSPEVAEIYAALLERRQGLPSPVLEQMLLLLKKVGDPSWARIVFKYTVHNDELIRLRALDCVYALGEFDVIHLENVVNDQSVLVQRWRNNQLELERAMGAA